MSAMHSPLPERAMDMTVADAPVTEPVTKIGGQPVWVDAPQWPRAAQNGDPMTFLGQFRLPTDDLRMAYLFMADGYCGATWVADGGENALIVQGPGAVLPSFVTVDETATGPSLCPDVHIGLVEPSGDYIQSMIGGEPIWIQADETPGDDWLFLFQLNEGGPGFDINFGDAGIGYGFVKRDFTQGRFLWQCS